MFVLSTCGVPGTGDVLDPGRQQHPWPPSTWEDKQAGTRRKELINSHKCYEKVTRSNTIRSVTLERRLQQSVWWRVKIVCFHKCSLVDQLINWRTFLSPPAKVRWGTSGRTCTWYPHCIPLTHNWEISRTSLSAHLLPEARPLSSCPHCVGSSGIYVNHCSLKGISQVRCLSASLTLLLTSLRESNFKQGPWDERSSLKTSWVWKTQRQAEKGEQHLFQSHWKGGKQNDATEEAVRTFQKTGMWIPFIQHKYKPRSFWPIQTTPPWGCYYSLLKDGQHCFLNRKFWKDAPKKSVESSDP